ncbi:MAG: hypothetical protein PHR28_06510 [candidate division Zixibacteria bacterium]|nr:hypothetical protein [candidate division Zixibacteria bacterium]
MPKMVIWALIAAVAFCLAFLLGATAVKAGDRIIDFHDLKGGLTSGGFEISFKQNVKIDGVGLGSAKGSEFYAYGWLIDASDRSLVWSMNEDCPDPSKMSDDLYECQADLTLSPGRYEVYYYIADPDIFMPGGGDISVNDLGDLIKILGEAIKISGDNKKLFSEEDIAELTFAVKTDGPATTFVPAFRPPEGLIAEFNVPSKDEYLHKGFTLTRETDLSIYAIGEYSESYDLFVDGGWILNADTREKAWSMDKWNTEWAEGARKNRLFKDHVTLSPGNYIAYYVTDDCHDPEAWNSPPPGDPLNYGMVISTTRPEEIKNVVPFNEQVNEKPIVAITGVHNSSFEKQGFTLTKPTRIHVLALGEKNYTGSDLADYGWIMDADNAEKVWAMTSDNTDFAGGAAKNCRFDGIVELPAGDYIVYYRTDDSHAYGSWNAARPFDYRNYGISIFGVGKGFSSADFKLHDDFTPTGNILVNLTGLGDDEDVEQDFTLSKPTEIKITAVGEGKDRDMYDYGWIEDDEGDTVWEMTYRKTRNAGGAAKNRMIIDVITLEKGTYTAHFITDDSHSYSDFNASPPDDPERWGIMITVH